MRVLVLTSIPRQPDNRALWEGLKQHAEVDIVQVHKETQSDLRQILSSVEIKKYDRVVLDLRFRYLSRQARLLKNISGLVIYEEDACQNFIPESKWNGLFLKFYLEIPNIRVIFTGYRTAQKFSGFGVDACFLPKGFDSHKLYCTNSIRDIELGFVGRTASNVYTNRRNFLDMATGLYGMQQLRAAPGIEYMNLLNRISTFLSADIGFGEYMAKNFEAMACGCLLFAFRQGEGEEEALGIVDGENAILYSDITDFARKLEFLREMPPSLQAEIAFKGMAHAVDKYEYRSLAGKLYEYLVNEMREPVRSRKGLRLGALSFLKRTF